MKTPILSLVLTFTVLGCASYSRIYINSEGNIQTSEASGYGVWSSVAASQAMQDADRGLHSLRYIDIDNVGAIGIFIAKNSNDSLVKIVSVEPRSPAQKSGILPNDAIIKIDGSPVSTETDAKRLLFRASYNVAHITVLRGNKTLEFAPSRAPYEEVFGRSLRTEKEIKSRGY
jgi:membrane-associated protease RseP (regulator of RpoE activity)